MNNVFPSVSTVSINDAESGTIVKLPRVHGAILALVTDHSTNGARSIVWLNSMARDRPSVLFIENWQNEESALRYNDAIWFDLGMADDEVDARGQRSWEMPGVILSIGDELFIRAAPYDAFRDQDKLVNIRTGRIFSSRPPNDMWSFLSWRLLLRDPAANIDLTLMEHRIKLAPSS
jgi:hypothetical protein